jgi:hypothetical protein
MDVGGSAELRSWILSFGSGAEVLEPAALRREVIAELGAALERYGDGPRARGRRHRTAEAAAPPRAAR